MLKESREQLQILEIREFIVERYFQKFQQILMAKITKKWDDEYLV